MNHTSIIINPYIHKSINSYTEILQQQQQQLLLLLLLLLLEICSYLA